MRNNFSLAMFETAAERLAPYIHKTPVMELPLKSGLKAFLKLENLQASGSFKIRGALNTVLSLTEEELRRGLVTASGGNHGMGVAYAGALTQTPTTIYLPENTPASKVEKLKKLTPDVIVKGAVWDDANALALEAKDKEGKTYIHPFADDTVIAGQGTIALETLKACPELDVLLVAIGGGGLISGVATAAKLINPNIKIIGIEATGAPTLYESVKAGELVTLDAITTKASTLAPRRSSEPNFSLIRENVDNILLVTDDQMTDAAKWLWNTAGIAVELSAAAAIAALHEGIYKPKPDEKVGVVICGAGLDGIPT
ncbi:threonine ammonia-lyase [Sneathiella limimaris]|uniref:threonine ammonia-lyase n=1 Tax=Sneathiella limimaris TaxID=1964213 RepID=UPI00146B29B1|nr:threonine/serine dehydratase [Sneathiella limimaris]